MTRFRGFNATAARQIVRPDLVGELEQAARPKVPPLARSPERSHSDPDIAKAGGESDRVPRRAGNHNQRPRPQRGQQMTTNELPAEIQAEIDTETEAILAAKDDGRRITHSGKLEKATFETPDGGESVWTYRLTDTTAYLCNTPLCTDDVEYGDVVVLEDRHGPDKLRVIVGSVEVED